MQFFNLFAFDGSQIVCFLTGCAIITMPIAGGALVCVRHYKFYIMEAFSMFQIFPFSALARLGTLPKQKRPYQNNPIEQRPYDAPNPTHP